MTNWTKEEFKAYLLLYAAQSDHLESDDEKELILSKVNSDTYKSIHREIDKDNDYQSIQKIIHNFEKFEYSKEDLDSIMDDIKSVFLSDGTYDTLEKNLMMGLRKILR
jgi:uncharacterized protein YpuA (DUF1002 family)